MDGFLKLKSFIYVEIPMKTKIFSSLFVLILLTSSVISQTTVQFTLDLRKGIQDGWLDSSNEKVGVRGELKPLSWNRTIIAKDSDGDGIYEITVKFRVSEDSIRIPFKIKVDGSDNPNEGWQIGGNHFTWIFKDRQSTVNLAWDSKPVRGAETFSGNIKIHENFKKGELAARDLFVYLPPGYQDGIDDYPVFYMHDGQHIFDSSEGGREWHIDEWAEKLIRSGEISPMIIVGIGNTEDRSEEYTPTRQSWEYELSRISDPLSNGIHKTKTGFFKTSNGDTLRFKSEGDTLLAMIPGSSIWQMLNPIEANRYYLERADIYFDFISMNEQDVQNIRAFKDPSGGRADLYASLIVNEIKPFIDQNYRTLTNAQHTAIGGSSFGGLITLYIGLIYPEVFGHLVVVSPSIWWDNRYILKAYERMSTPPHQRFWLYMGTAEGSGSIRNVREFKEVLSKLEVQDEVIQYVEVKGGQHNEKAWSEQAESILRFVFSY